MKSYLKLKQKLKNELIHGLWWNFQNTNFEEYPPQIF